MCNRNSRGKFAIGNTWAQVLPRNNKGKFMSTKNQTVQSSGTSTPTMQTPSGFSFTPSASSTVMAPPVQNVEGIDVPNYSVSDGRRDIARGRHTRLVTQEYNYDLLDGNGPKNEYREYLQLIKMAACILPVCIDANGQSKFLLVRQFRYPAFFNSMKYGSANTPEEDGWIYEVVAGVVDGNDTPEQTVIREAQEEGNVTIDPLDIRKIHHCFMTPGITNEEMSIFIGIVPISTDPVAITGLVNEGEHIRAKWMTIDEIRSLAIKGLIRDAKTLICLYAARVL